MPTTAQTAEQLRADSILMANDTAFPPSLEEIFRREYARQAARRREEAVQQQKIRAAQEPCWRLVYRLTYLLVIVGWGLVLSVALNAYHFREQKDKRLAPRPSR